MALDQNSDWRASLSLIFGSAWAGWLAISRAWPAIKIGIQTVLAFYKSTKHLKGVAKMEKMKNVKEVLLVLLGLGMAVSQAKANDGKVDMKDVGLLMGPLMSLPAAIDDADMIVAEWKGASDEDRAEVHAWVKSTFDIADDKIEGKVEAAIGILIQSGALIG